MISDETNHDIIVLLIETNMIIPSHSTSCYQMNLMAIEGTLTYLALEEMAANLADDIFKCIFINEKFVYFNLNFTEVCSSGMQFTIGQHWFR